MSDALTTLLETREWLLADGATGTNLFDAGLQSGDAPELWNIDAPEKIETLYEGAIHAGSDLFLTNSFGGTSARLKLHDAQDRVAELNRAAAQIARDAADRAGRPVVVGGSMGPTGELIEPVGPLSVDEAAAMFRAQGAALMEGGADLLWVETLSAAEEVAAAAQAAADLKAPWAITMSFDTAGRTMMGLSGADLVAQVTAMPHPPVAVGANCGVGASDLLRTLQELASTGTDIPLIAKGNAGIPKFVDGHIHYDGTPDLMADYAQMARDSGARIIGGCCGTRPAHLTEMKARLERGAKGEAPSLDQISERLGGFSWTSAEADGAGGSDAPARPRRRRRG